MDIQGEKINQSNFESVPLLDGGDDQEKGCDLGDHVKPIIYGFFFFLFFLSKRN